MEKQDSEAAVAAQNSAAKQFAFEIEEALQKANLADQQFVELYAQILASAHKMMTNYDAANTTSLQLAIGDILESLSTKRQLRPND